MRDSLSFLSVQQGALVSAVGQSRAHIPTHHTSTRAAHIECGLVKKQCFSILLINLKKKGVLFCVHVL